MVRDFVGIRMVRFSWVGKIIMGAIKFVSIFFVYSFGFLNTELYNISVTTNQTD